MKENFVSKKDENEFKSTILNNIEDKILEMLLD